MKTLIHIQNDLFDISSRLKEIDKGYEIFFNAKDFCFEVHNTRQGANTFCLKVPFDELDQRTVDLVWKTRIQNADKIFAEIDEQNAKFVEQQKNIAIQKAAEQIF